MSALSYDQVVEYFAKELGNYAFSNLMSGSMKSPWYRVPVRANAKVIAYMYQRSVNSVYNELREKAEDHLKKVCENTAKGLEIKK